MAFETIRYDGRDGRIRVTLARPDQRNALSATMVEELAEALERARRDEARALLLTAEGPDFAVGPEPSDRDFPSGEGVDLGAFVESRFNPLLRRLRGLPLPTVAAVQGLAAGAGANLALACDLVLAGGTARFVQDAATLALIPDAGGTWTLTRRLGEARAIGLVLTGEPLSGEAAARWGLIWRAVDDAALADEAEALAGRLAAGPTRAFALAKRAIRDAAVNDLDAQLGREADLQREAGHGEDFHAALEARGTGAAPVFTGR